MVRLLAPPAVDEAASGTLAVLVVVPLVAWCQIGSDGPRASDGDTYIVDELLQLCDPLELSLVRVEQGLYMSSSSRHRAAIIRQTSQCVAP